MARGATIVAVSGTSGAGKSTVITLLAAQLGGAITLHFDDYLVLGNDLGEIAAWLAGGGDPNGIATPRLAQDLRRLRTEAGVVIIEEPFGRARGEVAGLIDYAVHLDVPLDIALCRRLLRAIGLAEAAAAPALIADIAGQLEAFLGGGRNAYHAIDRAARGAADLVLDGVQPPAALVERILSALGARP